MQMQQSALRSVHRMRENQKSKLQMQVYPRIGMLLSLIAMRLLYEMLTF